MVVLTLVCPRMFCSVRDIDAVLVHQRRRSVAQLVRRVFLRIQPRLTEVLFDQPLDRLHIDAVAVAADEERVFILVVRREALGQIVFQRKAAGIVEVYGALLVALAEHTHGIPLKIRQVEPHQFGHTQARS